MKYLLICGGVGGAKLALGFSKATDSNSIDIVEILEMILIISDYMFAQT